MKGGTDGFQRMLIFLAGIGIATDSLAWSSKQFPLFEPVHQMAVEKVLASAVGGDDLTVLKEQQVVVDQDQKAAQSFEHSMTGMESPSDNFDARRKLFIAKTEQFISGNLSAAITKRQAGAIGAAMVPLGKAIHALEDATSPAHEHFQPWRDDESVFEVASHVAKERIYPQDGGSPGYEARLEGAVRWAYDIYLGRTAMPAHYFDANGTLLLPQGYLTPR